MSSFRFLFFILVATLAACGGGGGGGSNEDSGPAPTGVRILHSAIDAAPLDLFSSQDPARLVTSAFFAEAANYGRLGEGLQQLILSVHNSSSTVVDTEEIDVIKDSHYTVLFYGNRNDFGLRSSLIADNPGEIPEGKAAVKIIHGLVGAATLVGSVSGGGDFEPAAFGGASAYLFIDPGLHTITVRRATDGLTVANITAELLSGSAYTVFLAGEIDYFVASRLLAD